MSYELGILDKCPVNEGETSQQALLNMVELVRTAEQWGYQRFWIAEHHNTEALASPSPEILISWALAHTRKIKIGSGGVMLQHYSPYKVAENFNVLASLAPGRVELGIGKAPGGFPLSTRALQAARDPAKQGTFSEQLTLLDQYLSPRQPTDTADPLRATPLPTQVAQPYLLGASRDSAQLAVDLGWQFVFAAHLNGDRGLLSEFSQFWKANSRQPLIIALQVIVSEEAKHAEKQAQQLQLWQVTLENGQHVTVGSEAQAETFRRQSDVPVQAINRKPTAVLAGSPSQVLAELDALHQQFAIDEFMLDIPLTDPQARQETLRLLAREKQKKIPCCEAANKPALTIG